MLSPENALDRASALVRAAMDAGADAADAWLGCSQSLDVTMRLGALEDVGRSDSEQAALRVFIGKRNASVSTSKFDGESFAELAARAVAMARKAPEDAFAGLAPEELLSRSPPRTLSLDDGSEPDPETLRAMALATEETARGIAGITNSEGASASAARVASAVATSHGFGGSNAASQYSLMTSVIAERDGGKQRDYDAHVVRHFADLKTPEAVGRRAGERAVARLGTRKLGGGAMPVLFDRRVAPSLIGHLLDAINGNAIARKASFLLDALDKQIFAEGITIAEDPFMARGLRSRPFDGEGLAPGARHIIHNGILTGWLLNCAAARQLGMTPTGHAARQSGSIGIAATNVRLQPGTRSRAELIAGMKRGVIVNELIGQGVSSVTGDYSRGASGFAIIDGAIAHPVEEITIAGNLRDMFAHMEPASDDLEDDRGIDSPSLLVEGMTVASG